MNTDKIDQEEAFQNVKCVLETTISEIPMTEEDSELMHKCIDNLEEIFRKSNQLI